MLDWDAILLEYAQNRKNGFKFVGAFGFDESEGDKTLFTRDAGDEMRLVGRVFFYQGPAFFRMVCVQNLKRNLLILKRNDRFFMDDIGAHVRKLAQFGIANLSDF